MANPPTRSGNITGCHHLALCVHDIDVARPFYAEVLGLAEVPRPPEIADRFRREHGGLVVAVMSLNQVLKLSFYT